MKAEIAQRKSDINLKEEETLGTLKYCHNLEDRRAANIWLMDQYPEWQEVTPKKQRSWMARIRKLRKKINVGDSTMMDGKIPSLFKRKRAIMEQAQETKKKYEQLHAWSLEEMHLADQAKFALRRRSRVEQGIVGGTQSSTEELTEAQVARNVQNLNEKKQQLIRCQMSLKKHQSMVDVETGLPMSVAFDQIQNQMQLQTLDHHDKLVRINLVRIF
jgi:hypothetical protein